MLAGQGQAGGLDLRFSTDRSRTSFGWSIEEALVDCGTQTTSSVATVDENERDTFGLLTGTDDVVFFRIPVGAEPLSVWAEGVRSVADFDLDVYARYDSLPERDVFDFSSRVANRSDEWINVDAPRSGHALFVAVHSRAGAGSFNLRWAKVKPGQRWSSTFSRPLRVATSFIANPNQLAQIRDMISGSQRFVVGLTEGKVQLREVELYNRAGDCTCDGKGCDVCVRGIPGRAFCFGGMATLFSDEWSSGFAGARTMGHELGHCVLGLNDEYRDHGNAGESCFHGDTLCAATAMGNHWRASNLCNAHDHGRDVNRPGHTCTSCALFGQTCSLGSCNSCFLRGSSDWEDLVSTGKVFSRPLGTANANTYESYLAMPFSISNR